MSDLIKASCPNCNSDLNLKIDCDHEPKIQLLEKQLALAREGLFIAKYKMCSENCNKHDHELFSCPSKILAELDKIK